MPKILLILGHIVREKAKGRKEIGPKATGHEAFGSPHTEIVKHVRDACIGIQKRFSAASGDSVKEKNAKFIVASW